MSSLPPPSAFPPPQPHQQWQPPKNKEWSKGKTAFMIVAVIAVGVGFQVWQAQDREGGSSSRSSASSSPFKYSWAEGVCDGDGFTGRFTNTDTKEFNGKLWAVAKSGGKVIARDEEIVFSLAPGETETIEFVWIADGTTSCSIESVDWSY